MKTQRSQLNKYFFYKEKINPIAAKKWIIWGAGIDIRWIAEVQVVETSARLVEEEMREVDACGKYFGGRADRLDEELAVWVKEENKGI